MRVWKVCFKRDYLLKVLRAKRAHSWWNTQRHLLHNTDLARIWIGKKCVCVCVLCHYANIWVKTSTLIPKSCDFYFSSSPYWKELGSLWNCLDNLCSPLPCRQNNEYIFNGNLSEYIKRHRRVIKSGAWPLTTRNSYPVPPLCRGLICKSCLTPRLFITKPPRALWQWNTSTLIYWV